MEVKPGYKQTEVGVIPQEWEVKRLGEICEIAMGRTPPRLNQAYWGRGYKWLSIADLQTKFVSTSNEEITELAASMMTIISKGTLLMSFKLSLGRLCFAGCDLFTNEAICSFNKLQANAEFLYYVLGRTDFSLYGKLAVKGYTLNKESLKIIEVTMPPLPEQRAIATALSDVDGLLGGLDRLIAKKRDIKQAAMEQLLTGQTRLPGFHGEWEVKKVGEFADCTAGGTPSTRIASYWGGSIRWMSSGELNLKRVDEVEGRITEAGLHNSSATMLPAKCVLIGLAGQGKTRGTVAMNFVELCTNQSIAAVLPSSAFVPEYLYYNLDARYEELREMSTGAGGRGGLNLTIIKSVGVPFPTRPEQTAIASVLTEMDAELAALEQRREKTRALKQAMMQELLTGKIRLL